MMQKNDGERLAILETQVLTIDIKINSIEKSIESLHNKFDILSKMMTDNYVAKETFEEYKKNKLLERILTIIVTAIITGLVAFFLRVNNI